MKKGAGSTRSAQRGARQSPGRPASKSARSTIGHGEVLHRADLRARPLVPAQGYRLALAHYNGASLWFPNIASPVETFEWKGAH